MPVGTVISEAQRHELKSLPATNGEEGGFIYARPLPYGMKLERRDKSLKMSMEQKVQTGRGSRRKPQRLQEEEVQKIDLETLNQWAFQFDTAYCITDHNITDEKGVKLDFTNPLTINYLDPKVGDEIAEILADINGDADDDENFTPQPTLSSASEAIH